MASSGTPWKVTVWYDSSGKDGEPDTAVLIDDTIIAPSREVALMLAGWDERIGSEYKTAQAAGRLRTNAVPL